MHEMSKKNIFKIQLVKNMVGLIEVAQECQLH